MRSTRWADDGEPCKRVGVDLHPLLNLRGGGRTPFTQVITA
jgi:hypothetical protein